MTSPHDPLHLPCGQVLPNRLMKAAMSEALADPAHSPDTRLERLYRTWSEGGYGLLVTGNVMVDRTQLGEPGNVVIEDDRDLDALTRWSKSAHDAGVPIWVQLNHPGRQSNPLALGHIPVAPSAVPMSLPGSPTPRELTSPEIENIIERFATAADGLRGGRIRRRPGPRRPRLPGHPVSVPADQPADRRMGRRSSTTDAVPPGDRPPHPRPGVTRLRGERETQLGGLPTRWIQRGRITRRGRGPGGRRPRPDRDQRRELRVTGDVGFRRRQYPRPRGLLPRLRPHGAANWPAMCRWRSRVDSGRARPFRTRCALVTATSSDSPVRR